MSAIRTDSATLRDGIRVGIPFGILAFLIGFSFGVVAEPVMGAGAAIAMSAFVFAGAAAVLALTQSLIGAVFSAAAVTALLRLAF